MQFTLVRLNEECGELGAALVALERLLRVDRCNERAGQEIMRLLARQGRRPEALRVYQKLTQSLRDDLEVEPSSLTVQLHKDITAGEATQDSASGRERPGPPRTALDAAPRDAGLPTGTVTFVLTDVEGSTRLWEAQPNAMREALIRHDMLIEDRAAIHAGFYSDQSAPPSA